MFDSIDETEQTDMKSSAKATVSESMNLVELKKLKIAELTNMAKDVQIEGPCYLK